MAPPLPLVPHVFVQLPGATGGGGTAGGDGGGGVDGLGWKTQLRSSSSASGSKFVAMAYVQPRRRR